MFNTQVKTQTVHPTSGNGFVPAEKQKSLPVTRWEVLTPEVCQEYLSHLFPGQRIFRPTLAERYKGVMTNDKWYETHQGIAFDDQPDELNPYGYLFDGMHRLHAIIGSGVSRICQVTYGVNREAFSIIDTGATRSPADALRADGWDNCSQRAAAVRWCWKYDHRQTGGVNTVIRPSNEDIRNGAAKYQHVLAQYGALRPMTDVINTSLGCWLWSFFREANSELADDFCSKLFCRKFGEDTAKGIENLSNRLRNGRMAPQSMNDTEAAILVIKLWNAHFVGKDLKKVIWRPEFPLIAGRDPKPWYTSDQGLDDETDNNLEEFEGVVRKMRF